MSITEFKQRALRSAALQLPGFLLQGMPAANVAWKVFKHEYNLGQGLKKTLYDPYKEKE
jgi:hypothetical protein